ncbi:MAG: hypothetical protein ACK5MZ_02330 [Aestuariibaculum sp.]
MQHQIILNEIAQNEQENYKLGSNLYLGMAQIKDKKVCIAVAYKIKYCIKKIDQFIALEPNVSFSHISKIKTGETKANSKFYVDKPLKFYYL